MIVILAKYTEWLIITYINNNLSDTRRNDSNTGSYDREILRCDTYADICTEIECRLQRPNFALKSRKTKYLPETKMILANVFYGLDVGCKGESGHASDGRIVRASQFSQKP